MFARTSTRPRRALALGAAAVMAVSLGSLSAGSASAGRPDVPPSPATATTARQAPGPIHAGNTFGWYGHGGLVYDETFVGPLNHKRWHVDGPGAVRTQHGMLTLNTANRGTVSAQMTIPGRAYGRWETRLRQRQYGHHFTPYRVITELVPVTRAGEGCGEQNIALTGRKFQVRFTMQDVKGKRMNKARMQMDWLRYWTLQAPSERSTKAPAPKHTTYTLACAGSNAAH